MSPAVGARALTLPDRRCLWIDNLRLSDLVAKSLEKIARKGRGVFLYLHHTGVDSQLTRRELPASCPDFISIRAASSIASRPASAWCSTKAGIGAQILIDLGFKRHSRSDEPPKKGSSPRRLRHTHSRPGPLNLSTNKPTHSAAVNNTIP